MVRTQVQLTEQQVKALRELAAREQVSFAHLVRRGVDQLLRSRQEPSRDERLRRALAVAGRFRSGRGDLSAHHDDYLAEDFGK